MINYSYIAKTIEHFQNRKYKYIEVPYYIPKEYIDITLPQGHKGLETIEGTLVGSAEQSLVYLTDTKQIRLGKYIACTPCFRDDALDKYHQKHFMKVELFESFPKTTGKVELSNSLIILINKTLYYYNHLTQGFIHRYLNKVKTNEGYDIELNGVEIGSYGVRSYKGFHWVYGTGIAEPRFSTVLKEIK